MQCKNKRDLVSDKDMPVVFRMSISFPSLTMLSAVFLNENWSQGHRYTMQHRTSTDPLR